jgi:predicted O-linked N-acetylglucosamine transferase (SPINDLY family)
MLTEYDKDKFDVYAYNNSNSKPDSRTVKFKESVTVWKDVFGLKDDQLAEEIRKDRVDILVDLTGYSSGSRLLSFARKPASIQVCAWGYATSTGMKSMDYFFADNVIVPPEEKDLYVEDVVYLPNVVTHYCPEDKPAVAELPALTNGYITFGSFNRLAKISEDAFRLWVRVLQAVPNSRMVLKISELGDIGVQEWALKNFEAGGITRDRIIFLDKKPWYYHMGDFSQIDLGLDPYPHGGGVSTLESLCQGVPVITLKWPTIVGRLSTSILTTLGMTDWVAETQDDYVSIAVEKAKDLQALSDTRKGLRTKLESSIIGDYKAYAKEVETEYLRMWEKYVASKST